MPERRQQDGSSQRPDPRSRLERDVERLERRSSSEASFWRSLSVLGTIGWSIALPAVAGALFGHWIDERFESGVRFTLMLLTAGVMLGSMIAWRVVREHRD